MDRGCDRGVVARGGGRVAGLRHAERGETRLLLSDKHLAAVDRMLRSEEDRVLRVPDAQVSGEDADNEQPGRHTDHAGTLRRAMGLSERVAAAPVHNGHVAGQLGRQLGAGLGVRDRRTVDAVQLQGVQRDQRHVRKGKSVVSY